MSIGDETLALPPGELEATIASRGDSVWKYNDIRQFPTIVFASHKTMLLREDILELFLGISEDVSREQLQAAVE